MSEECKKLAKCPMFKEFATDPTMKFYIQLYCKGNFEKCERKKMSDQGIEVPPYLLPDGKTHF